MLSPRHIAYAVFDFFIAIIIVFRINWFPDIVNYAIAFVLVLFAIYELAT